MKRSERMGRPSAAARPATRCSIWAGLRRADAVFAAEHIEHAILAVARRRWVELKAAPDDRDLVAMREARQGRLEAVLADVAPGADDVRPDFDG